MPRGCREKIIASCVIILGFLNLGAGVYLVGPGVGWTGSVASSKFSGSSNTDGTFCTFGLPIVVLLCLLVYNISLSISTLSTGALMFGWNLGVCLCLTLLV